MNNNSIDKLDIINKGIAAKRLAEYKQTEGIRVGDYLKLPNGRYTRFTYDWEDGTIQAGGHSQSQYELYSKGHIAYSGSLEPSIDKNSLQLTPETKVGYMRYEGEFTGEEGLKSCGLQVVQRVFEVKPGAKISHFYDNPKNFEAFSVDGSKFDNGGNIFKEDKERKTKAIKAYYADRPQLKTLDEARKKGKRFGNWIIKVNLPDGTEFYTMTTFKEKWVYPGAVYGMWNELTLIEKAGSSMAKGGTIDTDTALLPEVIAYYLAESVILEKWKGKLTKENDAAIQEEITDWQDYLTKRAEYLYKHNADFKKKVKARGDNGLHYLNMMMAHWMGVQDERIGGSYGAKTDLAGAEKAKKRWLDSLKPQKKMEQGGEIQKVSGIFYRVDTGFTLPRGTTALDVVNFEADELDNEDSKIGRDKMKAAGIDLSKYSWKDITWVTKTKKHATRYGSARNVQQVEIKNGIIVSEDGDEGYLILELGDKMNNGGYILPNPIAVFQEKTDKGTPIGLKIRYYDVGERDWWYQLVGESYKPTEKPVYGKAGHWVSRKQYPTVKSLEKYHQNDNIFLVQDGNEQQSSEPLIYSEWSKKFLADFRAKHPNSTAPSNHVMSYIYDDYMSGFKMKQGGKILTWKDHQRHDYNASHLNVQPIPSGDKAKTYGKFNVDAIYLKGNPIPVGCLSSSFSDQVGELMRGANYVNNPANTKKVLDRFKKWAVDEYIFDKKGTYKRKELGLTPEKKFNISTAELNKFIAQINSIESLDDITYSVARQRYEQGGEVEYELDFVINVLTERKNLVVPEFVPPYKVITPKMIEDYKQAHMLMDAMLMKAHAENNEALVKKLQNLEFITWTLKVEQGAIRMNDLQSLGDYIAEAKALKSENFKQGGVIGKYKKLKAAAQELTPDDKFYISIYNKLNAHAKSVAKKHGVPANSLFEYMQTKQYLLGDDAESIIEKSYELGIAANKAGKARVPFHDKELEALVKQRANSDEMGSAIPYYDAWTKGFDSENRRAAFAVLDKPENVEMNKKFRNDFLKNRKKLTQ